MINTEEFFMYIKFLLNELIFKKKIIVERMRFGQSTTVNPTEQ